jgi:hypothetical protein
MLNAKVKVGSTEHSRIKYYQIIQKNSIDRLRSSVEFFIHYRERRARRELKIEN